MSIITDTESFVSSPGHRDRSRRALELVIDFYRTLYPRGHTAITTLLGLKSETIRAIEKDTHIGFAEVSRWRPPHTDLA